MLFLLVFVLMPFPIGLLAGWIFGKAAMWLSLLLTLAVSVYAIWIPVFDGWYPGFALMIPLVLVTAGAWTGSVMRTAPKAQPSRRW
jgi:hypothetical protein